ncbi:hemagglutinin repeat-containing protein [Paraburkholderia sp. LEh10]|uniref:hemagglutinin repeat-containing protein n=1 Tax=Paraburkholderia sp. LEh10 TaxID=2821353 RepID=UPI001AE2C77E|nr:hemagglutinin repeat-containing protein [Paraburkholderia sp. LEh10]MBP0589782.1 hemagglutinin repeat-containing protein [Paraburkholderia sp. LEh10]
MNAASSATIISGGDTNITGSQVNAKQVTADVRGNLAIRSVHGPADPGAWQDWQEAVCKALSREENAAPPNRE